MDRWVAIYADGGVVGINPSPVGGTWAFCAVDAAGLRGLEASGFLPAPTGNGITNNFSEFVAAVHALEAMPAGWAGILYSDSAVTLGRLFADWGLRGIAPAWARRATMARARLGVHLTGVLVQGHPTRAELAAGVGRRGRPVSIHNVYCDDLCRREAQASRAELRAAS